MVGKKLLTELDIVNDAVVLYLNKPNALVNGVKTYISEDRNVVPYREGATIYIPVRFVGEGIGLTESDFSELEHKSIGTVRNRA